MGVENLSRMEAWRAKASRIVMRPPGSDERFDAETIARHASMDFSRMSTWTIVCEEILDTENSTTYYRRARGELRRRGLGDAEIEAMRCFAWMTAGWLNFEMMVWEWVDLNASDIYRAIEWQFRDGWILEDERDELIAFARKYDR